MVNDFATVLVDITHIIITTIRTPMVTTASTSKIPTAMLMIAIVLKPPELLF